MKKFMAVAAVVASMVAISVFAEAADQIFKGVRRAEGGFPVRDGQYLEPEVYAEILMKEACDEAVAKCENSGGKCLEVRKTSTFAASGYATEAALFTCWADVPENAGKWQNTNRQKDFWDFWSANQKLD
jgi:hypothetical protein